MLRVSVPGFATRDLVQKSTVRTPPEVPSHWQLTVAEEDYEQWSTRQARHRGETVGIGSRGQDGVLPGVDVP